MSRYVCDDKDADAFQDTSTGQRYRVGYRAPTVVGRDTLDISMAALVKLIVKGLNREVQGRSIDIDLATGQDQTVRERAKS